MNANTYPACCSNCNQGRRDCVAPETCQAAEDGQPRRQRMPEGSLVVLLPVALLAVIAAVSLLAPYFR